MAKHIRHASDRAALAIAMLVGGIVVGIVLATLPSPPAAYGLGNWSGPNSIDSTGIGPLSCPTVDFCAALDGAGNALTYDGVGWSAATQIDPGINTLDSISCPTANFCAAMDNGGNVLTYNGVVWSAPSKVDPDIGVYALSGAVSCPTSRFCIAEDGGSNILTYNGATWSLLAGIEPYPYNFRGVSCPTTEFCVATGGIGASSGSMLTYDGTTWTAPISIEANAVYGVSCATTNFCAAYDSRGNILTYNGTSWSTPAAIDPHNFFSSVTCPTSSFCAAFDQQGNVFTFDGTNWSGPTSIDPATALSASCPTASSCVAVDGYGNAFTSPPGPIPTSGFRIASVSVSDAVRGVPYHVQLHATGGTAPYRWKIVGGALPRGLRILSVRHLNGVIKGIPKLMHVSPGTFTFTVQAKTRGSSRHPSVSATQTFTMTLL